MSSEHGAQRPELPPAWVRDVVDEQRLWEMVDERESYIDQTEQTIATLREQLEDTMRLVRLTEQHLTEGGVMSDEQPMMQCPECGELYEDFDGLGVLHCEKCGYCRHASVTDGVCDYCGTTIPAAIRAAE